MDILTWIDKKLKDRGITKYNFYPELIEVAPATTTEYHQKNDVYFLANAFTSQGIPIDGEILGADNALKLRPYIMQTRYYSHQAFTGKINIVNYDATQTMYVELIVASPILT